jgi:hypothetical protein
VSEPDHGELERAVVSYLSKHPVADANLRIQAKPFERMTWPPDSQEYKSELFLMAPARIGRAGSVLEEALSRVLSPRVTCDEEAEKWSWIGQTPTALSASRVPV